MKIKEKTITRTFTINTVEYIGMDITNSAVIKDSARIPGKYSKDELLVILRNNEESEAIKIVAITDVNTVEELRGIPESVFYNNSELIDIK